LIFLVNKQKIFRIRKGKATVLFLVNQRNAAGDREIHDGTEPGYRKANADIILSVPSVPPVCIAIASHFSAHIAFV
jgi:hypothetical protein